MKAKNIAAIVVLAALGIGLGTSPHRWARAEVPTGTPEFTDPLTIDNTYHPFVPLRIRFYELRRGDAQVLDVFLSETRTFVLGDGTSVACRVLQEWEIEEGQVLEISKNFFAQSNDGTVWYFGETVDVFEEGGIVTHEGSWLVGGGGPGDPADTIEAEGPAVFMPGNPEVGDVWKPEDLPENDLEEFVTALKFVSRVCVPAGRFEQVLKVQEKTPGLEFKWYAPGVGFLKSRSGSENLRLVEVIDNDDEEDMLDELDDLLNDLLGDEDEEEEDDDGEEDCDD